MDWNLIKVFLGVCKTGSLVEAAKLLKLSHTTAFRRLSELEKEMGTRLFDRIKGRYVLTDAGIEMDRVAHSIAHSFEDIDRRIAGKDEGASGVIRLTAPRSFSDNELPRYLTEFNRLYPEIIIELLVSNQELNLSDRSAEIALRVSHEPPDFLWGRRILSIDWGIYAAESYLQKNGTPSDPEDMKSHSIIAPTEHLRLHPAFKALLSSHSKLSQVKCNDLMTMASLAVAGHGLALLPKDIRRPDLHLCFQFSAAPSNILWVLAHPDLRKVKRIALLVGFLAKAFVKDPKWQ